MKESLQPSQLLQVNLCLDACVLFKLLFVTKYLGCACVGWLPDDGWWRQVFTFHTTHLAHYLHVCISTTLKSKIIAKIQNLAANCYLHSPPDVYVYFYWHLHCILKSKMCVFQLLKNFETWTVTCWYWYWYTKV